MGGCGLAYEYTFSKVATDLLGNSVQQWGIIIAVMMFFMGIGADLQKHMSDKGLLDKFIISELVLSLLGGAGPLLMIYAYGHINSHYIIVQYGLISIIGLLIGFEIPLLARINEQYSTSLKSNIGAILKMDYIGALFGALVWIFILPKFFTITETAFVLGLINILGATFSFICFWIHLKHPKKIVCILCCGLALLITGFNNAEHWTSTAEQSLYRDRVVFAETTRYQHIVITESDNTEIKFYINGHLQFSERDEFIYHEHLVHPAMSLAESHKNILVLGGGDGLAVRELLKYNDVEKITLVDLDPKMTELSRTFAPLVRLNNNSLNSAKVTIEQGSGVTPGNIIPIVVADQNSLHLKDEKQVATVNILNLDAAKFLEKSDGIYDVVIIDFPDPNAIELAKLYSSVFYHNLKSRLAPRGIFVQQSTSPIHAKEAFLCIGRTMEASGLAAIPFHDNVPSFGEWGWWIGTKLPARNSVSVQTVGRNLKARMRTLKSFGEKTKYLTPELVQSSLVFGKQMLKTHNQDITTFTNSAVFNYYIDGWKNE